MPNSSVICIASDFGGRSGEEGNVQCKCCTLVLRVAWHAISLVVLGFSSCDQGWIGLWAMRCGLFCTLGRISSSLIGLPGIMFCRNWRVSRVQCCVALLLTNCYSRSCIVKSLKVGGFVPPLKH